MGSKIKSFAKDPKKLIATAANPTGLGTTLAAGEAAGVDVLSGAKSLLGQNRFKGSVSPINQDAFNIKGGQEAAGIAGSKSKEAQERGKITQQAQQNLRGKRGVLIRDLERQLAGEKPSLAEAQLKQAQDRSLKQQLAAAGRSRGGNAASTQRALLRGQAEQAQATGREAAQARIQEDQIARQQLGQALTSGQQIEQQQMAQEQGQVEKYLALGFNMNQAQQQAQADLENLKVKQELGAQGLLQQSFDAAQNRRMQVGGGLLQGVATALTGSDKNIKKNIKKASYKSMSDKNQKKNLTKVAGSATGDKKESKMKKATQKFGEALSGKGKKQSSGTETGKAIGSMLGKGIKSLMSQSDEDVKKNVKKEFLDKLTAYSYEYKNPKKPFRGEGKQLSVMAQDLEKAGPIGKSMVKEIDGVKHVDYGKGFGAILAAQTMLNERLNEIEKKKRK